MSTAIAKNLMAEMKLLGMLPGGHPNSPTREHLKLLHP
jgi:hypothetical protein